MFLEKKTLLKIWLNPGLKLTIFRELSPGRASDWGGISPNEIFVKFYFIKGLYCDEFNIVWSKGS